MKFINSSVIRIIIITVELMALVACGPVVSRDSLRIGTTVEPPVCLEGIAIQVTSSPSTIVYGESSVVSWSVDLPTNCGAMSVRLNGIKVPKSGSRTVSPSRTTAYHVTVFFNIRGTPGEQTRTAVVTVTYQRVCPDEPAPHTVEIKVADPEINKDLHKLMRDLLVREVQVANTTILLGPDVVLDFSDASNDDLPLRFAPCVTLTSANAFGIDTNIPLQNAPITNASTGTTISSPTASPEATTPQPILATPSILGDNIFGGSPEPARTPHSLGPLLKFGPHRSDEEKYFLYINCEPNTQPTNDNVRISGFRLYGPSFDHQQVDDVGIFVKRCINIEISNMEIAGWGGAGISVTDIAEPEEGPGQEQPDNHDGERIGRTEQVRIFQNYIHHNQHPRTISDSHTAGYGVVVGDGAWAQIYENVFDFNRHAIAASWDAGGYDALRNLVLKGGGIHYTSWAGTFHTHEFDIHGSGGSGKGGQAGVQFLFAHNSFQYLSDNAIYVRGTPKKSVTIRDNVFAHEGLEDDWGDDAINIQDRDDINKVIFLGPNNVIEFDSYGRYGVCDFDGDGIDDLFLPTGETWWFSSYGEYQWSYLSARTQRLNQVRLGYFDEDKRCDVLTERGAEWVISSGGIGPWKSIGAFGAPLSEVAFGQFDPTVRDHRPGVTRKTTHAFWRTQNGEWLVSPLAAPFWQNVQSSSFPMSKLRFGDFTGDGVTDVLAVQDGRWSISESARSNWRILNKHLSDDVKPLFIADLNNNNIDDLIRLERTVQHSQFGDQETFTWWVSDDGNSPWRKLKTYTFPGLTSASLPPVFAFAGRFGAAPGGGVLLIDHHRIGQFYSEADGEAGASPDWTALFRY